MLASTQEPGGDRGLSEAEDPLGGGWVQPFSEGREHLGDLLGRGFQPVQGGVASGSERGMAGLATERLDLLSTTVLAIADQSVDLSIGVAEVGALLIGTGEARGVHALGCSSAAFHLRPGAYRSRCWLSTRRGGGGETTGRAIVWAAGLQQTVERATLGLSA